MAYDILSLTAYKRICTCANMVSDITVVIQDDSVTSDNTWSSSKVAEEINLAKEELRNYMEEDDLSRIDITVTNIIPSEENIRENTMYLVKVFDDKNLSVVLYYKIYMKFGDHLAFLGDSNIGQSDIYSKEEADEKFLGAKELNISDNVKGLTANTIYRSVNQAVPSKLNTEDVYPILCDRKNNSHAESFKISLHHYTDRFDGYIVYKMMNGMCHVKFELKTKGIYISNLLEYQIIDDKTIPLPVSVLGNSTPCTVLTSNALYSGRCFVYITPKGGIMLRGDGLDLEDKQKIRTFRGSLTYSIM